MRHRIAVLCGAAWSAVAPIAVAEQAPITVDGAFADWSAVAAAWTDPAGDGGGSGVDFGRLWIADDDGFLFLRLEVGAELDFSEDNAIRIYLDTDDDAGTGTPVAGIGAELEWRFGERSGFFVNGGSTSVFHEDIRFRAAPTVTSTVFEFAFGRDALPDGDTPLFQGPVLRVVVRDAGGDQLPDGGGGVAYTFDQGQAPPPPVLGLDRERAGDLRLITFNVHNDGPWAPGLDDDFGRLLAAVDPDVVCFQEIYDHSPDEAAALVSAWLPGHTWSAAGNGDCKTVTRLPLLGDWAVGNELAVLLDAGAALGTDLLVVNAHLPCCTNDAGRQDAVDEIMAFLRDAQAGGGPLDLEPLTPFVIAGDLNLVGFAQQLETLLAGDIVDEGSWGPDFAPDWDATALANTLSRQTEIRMGYTWRSDTSSFWPGHLDFVITSDSVLETAKDFLLYTPEMSPESLDAGGLLPGDSLASDHLLFAADFRPPCPADTDGDGTVGITDLLALLAQWGEDPGGPPDLDGDGEVGITDFLLTLAAWGPCSPGP